MAVAFDMKGPTFRHEAFAAYKAQRARVEEDLASQIPLVHQVVESLGLPIYMEEGFEADDCLGTLARQGEALGLEVLIVTGDRDLLQLVSPSVTALLTRKGISQLDRLDPAGVEALLGVPPQLVTDYKALVGDPSDNIPGVPGVGPKTATRLLADYGSLEALLEQAGQVRGGQMALAEHREAALQGKLLTTIRCRRAHRARSGPGPGGASRGRAGPGPLPGAGVWLPPPAGGGAFPPGIDLAPGSPGPEGVAAGSGAAGGPGAEALLLESRGPGPLAGGAPTPRARRLRVAGGGGATPWRGPWWGWPWPGPARWPSCPCRASSRRMGLSGSSSLPSWRAPAPKWSTT